MRLTNTFVLSAFLFLIACAYGQDVHYNYDRGANFSAYKTYQWVDLPGGVGDQLIDQAIKRSIDEQLAQKGLTKVEKNATFTSAIEPPSNWKRAWTCGVQASAGGADGATVRCRVKLLPFP